MTLQTFSSYTLFFIIPGIITLLFIPQIYKIAKNVGAIDDPSKEARKIHKKKIPRLGGLAIYIAFLLSYALFSNKYSFPQMESVLIGSFLIVLMGIFDDISPIKSWKKFLIQILAAVVFVYRGNLLVEDFQFFIFDIQFGWFSPIFTILWIVTITNAINLSDGMDGLAGGFSIISLITMAIIGSIDIINGFSYASAVVMVALLLAGAISGFLPYNLPPAKIFMGDSGAQFIGFMIGVLSVLGYKQAAFTSFLVPVALIAIPLFDTILAFSRRLLAKQTVGVADANHLHHLVLNSVQSQYKSLFWLYGLSILFSISAIIYSFNKNIGLLSSVIAFILAELFVEYFHIISPRYSPLLRIASKFFPDNQFQKNHKIRLFRQMKQQKKDQHSKKDPEQ